MLKMQQNIHYFSYKLFSSCINKYDLFITLVWWMIIMSVVEIVGFIMFNYRKNKYLTTCMHFLCAK